MTDRPPTPTSRRIAMTETEPIVPNPKIYLTAFPLHSGSGCVHGSIPGGDVMGSALAEDGTGLASHLSSSKTFAQHDMGLTSDWKHDLYTKHYPNGYELVWIDDARTDPRWQAALALNRERHPQKVGADD